MIPSFFVPFRLFKPQTTSPSPAAKQRLLKGGSCKADDSLGILGSLSRVTRSSIPQNGTSKG